jgi:hypothetical protein
MDLTGFDIQAPGPRTEQRVEMEKVSAPPLIRTLAYEPFTDRDIWTATQLKDRYYILTSKVLVPESVGRELAKHGILSRKFRTSKGMPPERVYALRNFSKWELLGNDDWIKEMEEEKF